MVLHPGDDDLIAGLNVLPAEAVRDQVDRLGACPCVKMISRRQVRVAETLHLDAGRLVGSVARSLSRWTPRWTLALSCS